MTIGLIITSITLGVVIFFIIYKRTNIKIKLQFNIDKKNQVSNTELEENQIQKSSERPQKELGKNKWLYTTDNFGKMKKGRVL
ncbi:hypothetical protein [uncultured Polaribacter sp.]|uniref:hypothetical protein n=1 Tax=uncultured Polaribacter sp. TaxID=174711 RepID=UPI0030DDB167|tara:strand:- start:222 stop:470 length:249 start_codon:yes stop_codon:yes gene_type:complete